MSRTGVTVRELKHFAELAGLPKSGNKDELVDRVKKYLRGYKTAPRYTKGLGTEERFVKRFEIRYSQLRERKTGKKDYSPSRIDRKYSKGKTSTYTEKWNRKHPGKTSIRSKSRTSGVSQSILQKVYNKGLAAWRGSAHRPGATAQQWANARVNSFLTCGKTWYTADNTLAREAMAKSPKAKKFWKNC
jgi:hypothetical protein